MAPVAPWPSGASELKALQAVGGGADIRSRPDFLAVSQHFLGALRHERPDSIPGQLCCVWDQTAVVFRRPL